MGGRITDVTMLIAALSEGEANTRWILPEKQQKLPWGLPLSALQSDHSSKGPWGAQQTEGQN